MDPIILRVSSNDVLLSRIMPCLVRGISVFGGLSFHRKAGLATWRSLVPCFAWGIVVFGGL